MKPFSLPPLKRFGQNFLLDPNIKRKIFSAAGLTPQDTVLEIGPGYGSLTFDMAKACGRLVALEIDKGLCARLSEQTKEFSHLTLICQDILAFDLEGYFQREGIKKAKVVSNLPYYITTPILEYLFKRLRLLDDIFLTLQKEVAQRMISLAGQKDYGSLSCFVRYHCEPQILFKIPAGCFRPKPKVESVFMRLKPRQDAARYWNCLSEDLLFSVVRSAFGQRRKKLRSCLSLILSKGSPVFQEFPGLFERRPEEISLEEFIALSNGIARLSLGA
ncbi:MAG: 16S rRNA (adenine(1518)-N(6)/adenine(1519)-N(6))-dimethyltransferase RsmA [Candidatus Omnitrophota bacterium]